VTVFDYAAVRRLICLPIFAVVLSGAAADGVDERQQAERQFERMRAIRSAIDRTSDKTEKANHWLDLNAAADELAVLVERKKLLIPILRKVASLGISVEWCEPDGMLVTGIEGYEKYLKLWPTGPRADEAWWQARVASPHCRDFEGSKEEYETALDTYSDFIRRFPKSRHLPEAREVVAGARKVLEGYAKNPPH
jgi:hypothetical protein